MCFLLLLFHTVTGIGEDEVAIIVSFDQALLQ
jgi:hypothetical protein